MSITLIHPRFQQRLAELRKQHNLSYRDLGRLTAFPHTHIWEIEVGRKRPTVQFAAALDVALAAGGELAKMVSDYEPPITPDDDARLTAVIKCPRRVDTETVDSLATMLAHQRRVEDTLGSTLLVQHVCDQLDVVEKLVPAAPDARRIEIVTVASQWAQFAGWLCTTTGNHQRGRELYGRTMEWAAEVGDADMMATALSMRGHLAWIQDNVRPMLNLSRAAGWQPAGPAVRALAAQQEARAHALTGNAADCDARLDLAEDLAHQAAANPEQLPKWLYFYEPDVFALQRGLAQHLLRRHERAIELLSGALDVLPAEVRHSDWIGWYVCQLAAAHAAVGDDGGAAAAVGEAREIAQATGARRLTQDVDRLARQLGL